MSALKRPLVSRFVIKIICILGATIFFIFYWNLLTAIATLDDIIPGSRPKRLPEGKYSLQKLRSQPSLELNVAHVTPKTVHTYVDPTFAAFACEERSFLFYAGPSGEPNVFSRNLLHEVSKRTGVKPVIRVGGTSLDHSTYESSQKDPVRFPSGREGKNIPLDLKFGPSFFESFANLPDAMFILDIPLAKANMDNSIKFIQDAVETIGLERIEQLEVGNEPNLYPGNGRPQDYGPGAFVQEWEKWTTAISAALNLPLDEATYEAVALASPRYPPVPPWQVQHVFDQGLDDLRGRIKSYSIHYYQTRSSKYSNLQQDLMNHTSIAIGIRALAETVEYLNTKVPRIPLNIAEFGSALNPKINDYALESVLGAALWQVDFMMQLLTIGVNRAHIQLGIGFGFAPWQPIEYRGIPAKVNAPYYAHILIADLIGHSRHMQIAEIATKSDILSAYAAYEGGKLAKVIIVNLKLWSSLYDDPNGRGVVDINFEVPERTRHVEVRRLTSALGATASDSRDIYWAGQSWSWESEGRSEQVYDPLERLQIEHGHVAVRIESSEAVVVDLIHDAE